MTPEQRERYDAMLWLREWSWKGGFKSCVPIVDELKQDLIDLVVAATARGRQEADAKHEAPQAGRDGTHWWITRSALIGVATMDEAFISSHVAGEIVHVVEVLPAPDACR